MKSPAGVPPIPWPAGLAPEPEKHVPMVGSKKRRSEQDRIVRAALHLMGEHGADRVGPSDIVKHLGIVRAEMKACFPSEDDLWAEVVAALKARMQDNWNAIVASDQTAAGKLRSLVAVQAGLVMGTPALPATLFSCRWRADSPVLRNGFLRIRHRFRELLGQVVEQGQRSGELSASVVADEAARQIVEAFQGIVASWWLTADSTKVISAIWTAIDHIVNPPATRARQAS